MNKEQIEERIKNIETEMQQVKAHYAKLEGHLLEAHYWLAYKAPEKSELHIGEYDGEANNKTEECATIE